MFKRRRFKQSKSLAERLATFAQLMRERTVMMPPGPEKASILTRAEQADRRVELEQWARSSELTPPK